MEEKGLQIFENPEFGSVRTVEENGTILFCGSDVAKALGYAKPRNAVTKHCPHALKRGIGVQTGEKADGSPAMQDIEMLFIPESDIYRLVFRSELKEADRFVDWVTQEVIPSIRKHETYMTPEMIERVLFNPDTIISIATQLKQEREQRLALESENAQQRQLIAEYEPKVSYYDIVLNTKNAISINKIAKDYGETAQWLNNYLREKGIQYKQGDIWLLNKKYAKMGYTKSRTHFYGSSNECFKIQTCWTQKGRLFIYDLLKADGILPVIEKEAA